MELEESAFNAYRAAKSQVQTLPVGAEHARETQALAEKCYTLPDNSAPQQVTQSYDFLTEEHDRVEAGPLSDETTQTRSRIWASRLPIEGRQEHFAPLMQKIASMDAGRKHVEAVTHVLQALNDGFCEWVGKEHFDVISGEKARMQKEYDPFSSYPTVCKHVTALLANLPETDRTPERIQPLVQDHKRMGDQHYLYGVIAHSLKQMSRRDPFFERDLNPVGKEFPNEGSPLADAFSASDGRMQAFMAVTNTFDGLIFFDASEKSLRHIETVPFDKADTEIVDQAMNAYKADKNGLLKATLEFLENKKTIGIPGMRYRDPKNVHLVKPYTLQEAQEEAATAQAERRAGNPRKPSPNKENITR